MEITSLYKHDLSNQHGSHERECRCCARYVVECNPGGIINLSSPPCTNTPNRGRKHEPFRDGNMGSPRHLVLWAKQGNLLLPLLGSRNGLLEQNGEWTHSRFQTEQKGGWCKSNYLNVCSIMDPETPLKLEPTLEVDEKNGPKAGFFLQKQGPFWFSVTNLLLAFLCQDGNGDPSFNGMDGRGTLKRNSCLGQT